MGVVLRVKKILAYRAWLTVLHGGHSIRFTLQDQHVSEILILTDMLFDHRRSRHHELLCDPICLDFELSLVLGCNLPR